MSLQEEKTGVLLSRVGMYKLKCRRRRMQRIFTADCSQERLLLLILSG
jgi:hypothetical protein